MTGPDAVGGEDFRPACGRIAGARGLLDFHDAVAHAVQACVHGGGCLLYTSVGLTMQGDRFLQKETLLIILLGIVAFGVATAGGVIAAKLMNLIWRKNPVNPLIGSAGVSAVPMAARVSHNVGQKYDCLLYTSRKKPRLTPPFWGTTA